MGIGGIIELIAINLLFNYLTRERIVMEYTPEEKSQSDAASLKESVNNLKEAIKKIIDSDDDNGRIIHDFGSSN